MGRQWNTIIESLGPLTGGSMSISANLTDIEALLTTLQADVADGIIVSSGTVNSSITNGTITTGTLAQVTGGTLNSNLRDGSGNLLTSGSRGSERALSVQIVDASGNQITSFGTANVSITNGTINSNIRDGSGNSITSTSISGKQRLDVTLAGGGTIGSASPTFADLVAGTDGTNLRALSTDAAGRVNTNINGTVTVVDQDNFTPSGFTNLTLTPNGTTSSAFSTVGYGSIIASVTNAGSGLGFFCQQSIDGTNFYTVTANSYISIVSSATNGQIGSTGLYAIPICGTSARFFLNSGTTVTFSVVLVKDKLPLHTNAQVSNTVVTSTSMAPATNAGHSTHHTAISAAGTNLTQIKVNNGNIGFFNLSNTTSSFKYIKLYNASGSPVVGTTTPTLNVAIPPSSTIGIDCGWAGIRFANGIWYAITGGQAALDTTSVAAGDVMVNISYA